MIVWIGRGGTPHETGAVVEMVRRAIHRPIAAERSTLDVVTPAQVHVTVVKSPNWPHIATTAWTRAAV